MMPKRYLEYSSPDKFNAVFIILQSINMCEAFQKAPVQNRVQMIFEYFKKNCMIEWS